MVTPGPGAEGLGGIWGFLAFLGRIRTRGGPFRVLSGTRRPSKIHPYPGFKLEFEKTHLKSKN